MTAPVQVGPSPSGGGPVPSLSDVELRVLEGRATGLTYMAIAARIHYTYRSAKDVGSRVIDKLGARDMAHAVFLAVQMGLLEPRRRHGDHAGFAAHVYRDEDPCEACREGENEYRRDRRAARNAAKAAASRSEMRTS